jgi:hypothetical protein
MMVKNYDLPALVQITEDLHQTKLTKAFEEVDPARLSKD